MLIPIITVEDNTETHAELIASNTTKSDKRKKRTTTGQPRLTELFTVSKARPTLGTSKTKVPKKSRPDEDAASEGSLPQLKSALKSPKPVSLLDKDSCLYHSTIRGTASTKLSYLLDKVAVLHKEEKTLIFYEGDHIAYYIAQALELINVRYLIYTKTLDLALKSAYIATFNMKDIFRVMLMDIREAAHGLHVASASRVFFVNPVWQPSIEAQAIKRAHRIGQTRPVYVETLILKGTLEDQILKRRKGMTTQEHQKAERSLLDDEPMSAIIENAHLLPLPLSGNTALESQVAPLQTPIKVFGRTGNHDDDPDNPYAELIFPIETPKTKKLNVKKRTIVEVSAPQPEQDSMLDKERNVIDDNDTEHGANVSTPAMKPVTSSDTTMQDTRHSKKKRVGFAVDSGSEILTQIEQGVGSTRIGEAGPSTASTVSTSTRRVGFDLSEEDTGNFGSIFGR